MGRSNGSTAHYRNASQSLSHSPSTESFAVEDQPLLASLREASGEASRYQLEAIESGESKTERLKDYFAGDVDLQYTDLILVVCFFVSGLVDSGAYNVYQCFVSMQTGNTIFAALGISDLPLNSPKFAWTKSVTSIVAFLLGALAFGVFHRTVGQTKRSVLATSFGLQTALIVAAALLIEFGRASEVPRKQANGASTSSAFPKDPGFPWSDLIPIAMLAFQASGKVVASRMLGWNGMPTIVLTTMYNDLASDPALLTAGLFSNASRNRKVAGIVLYVVGAIVGGVLAKGQLGFAGVLWLAAATNFAVVAAWLLWKVKREDDEF